MFSYMKIRTIICYDFYVLYTIVNIGSTILRIGLLPA